MVDRLAAVGAGVDDDAIAVAELFGAGDLRGDPVQVAEEASLALIGVGHGIDVLARDDEDVDGRLGMQVGEGVGQVVGINGGGGNASFGDLAKDAAHDEISLHGSSCGGALSPRRPKVPPTQRVPRWGAVSTFRSRRWRLHRGLVSCQADSRIMFAY
jgi:hypothetical protein